MKILLVHNEYAKRSGEEAVVDKMEQIFRSLGHHTARLTMSTAEARESLPGKFRAFATGIHSPAGIRAMRDAIRRERPDLVNVHNLYPFISPAALRECKKAGIPVVMTVHNFRLICPTGLFMRDGAPCERCLDRGNEWGCIRFNCENSLPKSIAYAARNAIARLRRHYLDCVDRFACITDFQRQKLAQAGFPPEKLLLIPNSIDLPDQATGKTGAPACPNNAQPVEITVSRRSAPGSYVAFVGRLSREKGIDLIIEAARRNPDIPFRLAGAVADPSLVADLPANVQLAGFISGKDLDDFYQGASFMLMASRWYEGFPMSILESASHARATIAPNHGGFPEIIKSLSQASPSLSQANPPHCAARFSARSADKATVPEASAEVSLLFPPADPEALSAAIRRLWDNPDQAQNLGQTAQQNLRSLYSTPVIATKWQSLLQSLSKQGG